MKIEVNKTEDSREPKAYLDGRGALILPNAFNARNTVIRKTGDCGEGLMPWIDLKDDYTPLYEGDVITITL